jgi:hypothetical protein
MSKPYQGHKSYNAWNVCLWLFNDEALYGLVRDRVQGSDNLDEAAEHLYEDLEGRSTPDGVPYTKSNIRLALRGEKK